MATPANNQNAVNDLRIRLSDPDHLDTWAERLGVSEDELRSAIQRAGTWAPAVEKLLTGSSSLSSSLSSSMSSRPSGRGRDEGLRASP